MKIANLLGLVVGAVSVPAIAAADVPADPYAAPSPAPQPTPVIVVNPQPTVTGSATVIERNPEVYEVSDAWNAPVFTTGALVFVGSYGASAVVAGSSDHVGADRLYVPVVGPWLALNDWGDCPIEEPRCDKNTTDKILLVADGVFQAAGMITMVTGLVSPSTHTVVVAPRSAKTEVKVTPTHNGLAVVGKF
jgi:hypothetical protein